MRGELILVGLGNLIRFLRQNVGTLRGSPGKIFVLFPKYVTVIATDLPRWLHGKFSFVLIFRGLRNFLCPNSLVLIPMCVHFWGVWKGFPCAYLAPRASPKILKSMREKKQ